MHIVTSVSLTLIGHYANCSQTNTIDEKVFSKPHVQFLSVVSSPFSHFIHSISHLHSRVLVIFEFYNIGNETDILCMCSILLLLRHSIPHFQRPSVIIFMNVINVHPFSCFILLLIMCGDVETNPGPSNSKSIILSHVNARSIFAYIKRR